MAVNRAFIVLIVVAGCTAILSAQEGRGTTAPAPSKIHKLEELTWARIDALDRYRTLFILPLGMLEQHGPHLPVGADTIGVTYEANGVARRVSRSLPDWRVVMMPAINYGQAGANLLGEMPVHPAPTVFDSRR